VLSTNTEGPFKATPRTFLKAEVVAVAVENTDRMVITARGSNSHQHRLLCKASNGKILNSKGT
jgi:hypothetical protein